VKAHDGSLRGPQGRRDELAKIYSVKGLILAQNERWRRDLGMQVERESRKTSTVAKG
jgi:hypothetical protein